MICIRSHIFLIVSRVICLEAQLGIFLDYVAVLNWQHFLSWSHKLRMENLIWMFLEDNPAVSNCRAVKILTRKIISICYCSTGMKKIDITNLSLLDRGLDL